MNDQAKIQLLKDFYEALNRFELDWMMANCHPEIMRNEPHGHDTAGIFTGLDAFKAHIIQGRSTWDEGGCYPEEIFAVGDKFVVNVHVRVRLKDKTDWLDGRLADGYTFRDDKISLMQTFWERSEARQWAGLDSA